MGLTKTENPNTRTTNQFASFGEESGDTIPAEYTYLNIKGVY